MTRETPPIVWQPSAQRTENAEITRYMTWLDRGFTSYDELHRWSVDDLEGFWASIWAYFEIPGDYDQVLASRGMPGAQWFTGARVNYAERILAARDDDEVCIRHGSETRPLAAITQGRLRDQVARIRSGLIKLGVGEGDRVAAYLPNIPETIAAFLATASLGAIWTSAAPEFGSSSVIDRFAQIEPKVLFGVDGYRYGGKDYERAGASEQIAQQIGARLVRFGYLDESGFEEGFLGEPEPFECVRVAFDHPLWVLYSSGTTGLPKAIVHGHGGMLVEHLKNMALHLDAQAGDRVLWFTTTGWMMWNFLVGVLHTPASIILYDGNPGHPSLDVLWDFADEAGATCFGTGAAFIAQCMKSDVRPRARPASVGVTGSPLSPEGFDWVREALGDDTWLFSTSGGTDVCTAFVGGVPTLPVYRGELQAAHLGCDVQAWDDDGNRVIDAVGELVIPQPMPSMPVSFWDDPDGSRLREAYFEHYPGVWRHGDWVEMTSRGSAVIYGRSDSTINRGGVRMGTSEIYRAVLADPDVLDALVVDVPREGEENWMPLFVVLDDGVALDDALIKRIRGRVREDCSPRHVPSDVIAIAEVPRTLSGKALEVPVKRILTGTPPEQAASRESLANPSALDAFVELAARAQP